MKVNDLSVRSLLIGKNIFLLIVFGAIIALFITNIYSLLENSKWVAHTHNVIRLCENG